MDHSTWPQPSSNTAKLTALRPPLTADQYRVLLCLTQDLTAKEIAARLEISESAAKHHIEKLRDKFHVRKTSALAYLAWEYLRDVKGPTLKAGKPRKPQG